MTESEHQRVLIAGQSTRQRRWDGARYSPMTWTLISRRRGPSNSAKMMDWNRPRGQTAVVRFPRRCSVQHRAARQMGMSIAALTVRITGLVVAVATRSGTLGPPSMSSMRDPWNSLIRRPHVVWRVFMSPIPALTRELLNRLPHELRDPADLCPLFWCQAERGVEDLHIVPSPFAPRFRRERCQRGCAQANANHSDALRKKSTPSFTWAPTSAQHGVSGEASVLGALWIGDITLLQRPVGRNILMVRRSPSSKETRGW